MHVKGYELTKQLLFTTIKVSFTDGRRLEFRTQEGIFGPRVIEVKLEGVLSITRFKPPQGLEGNGQMLAKYWLAFLDKLQEQIGWLGSRTDRKASDTWHYLRDSRPMAEQLRHH